MKPTCSRSAAFGIGPDLIGLTAAFIFFVRKLTRTGQWVRVIAETLKTQKGVEHDV